MVGFFLYKNQFKIKFMLTWINMFYYSFLNECLYLTKCCWVMPQGGGGGGGGTLKFSVYIGEADFFGVKILNFRIFWGFQKN